MIFPRPIQTSPKYYCVCYHATRTDALSAAILASSSATAGVLGVATVTLELDFTSSVPQPSLAVVTHWMYLKRVPLLVCREVGGSRPSCVPPTPCLDITQAPGRFFEGVMPQRIGEGSDSRLKPKSTTWKPMSSLATRHFQKFNLVLAGTIRVYFKYKIKFLIFQIIFQIKSLCAKGLFFEKNLPKLNPT